MTGGRGCRKVKELIKTIMMPFGKIVNKNQSVNLFSPSAVG